MKVILLQNLENVGLPGEITEVRSGYFRNFLCPRGIAVEASPSNLKSLEFKRKKLQAQADKIVKEAQDVAEQLKGVTLKFVQKVGEKDRLFGSVTAADVADQLAALGFEIDKRRISLSSAIKTLGTFSARVKLHAKVAVPLTVIVERDMTAEPPVEAATEATSQPPAIEETTPESASDESASNPA